MASFPELHPYKKRAKCIEGMLIFQNNINKLVWQTNLSCMSHNYLCHNTVLYKTLCVFDMLWTPWSYATDRSWHAGGGCAVGCLCADCPQWWWRRTGRAPGRWRCQPPPKGTPAGWLHYPLLGSLGTHEHDCSGLSSLDGGHGRTRDGMCGGLREWGRWEDDMRKRKKEIRETREKDEPDGQFLKQFQ